MHTLHEKIVEMLNTGIIVLEKDGCIVTWNQWITLRSGITEENVRGLPILEVLPELQNTRIARAINKALNYNSPSVLSAKLIDASFPLYKDAITGAKKPERLVQSIQIKPFFQERDGQHCVISIFDISSSDLRERALRTQSTTLNKLVGKLQDKDYELKTLFQNTQNAIIIFDDTGKIFRANPAALNVLGYTPTELLKLNAVDILRGDEFEDETDQHIKDIIPIDQGEVEMLAIDKNEDEIFISASANVIPYENKPTRYFVFFRDITERKVAEKKLHRLAKFDSLTKLPNRASFLEMVNQSIEFHRRLDNKLSVFFVDLDKFKNVNDSFGHSVGDQILVMAAERLSSCCRASDIVGRWAGDEFVLLINHQTHGRSAITVAEKLVEAFRQPFLVSHNRDIDIGCSIGVAQFPDDGESPENLISCADHAMYHAKSSGSNLFRFFTPEMNEQVHQRLKIEADLKTAIKDEQFCLYFQPQVNVVTGELIGVEALIRWQHPEQGLILPDSFITIAEECGLIVPIGNWVLKHAIETAAGWYKQGENPLKMSVNLSPRQFVDEGLPSKLHALLNATGLPPNYLVVEITEGHLLGNSASNVATLNSLKALGIKIAIDDFGTGYSSLSYLRNLPVDIIKIDREFLIDSGTDKTSAHIVSAIIELSHALELEVVAEGVEYDEQLQLLKKGGCDQAQGFFLGKPMGLEEFSHWFDAQKRNRDELH